MAIDYSKKINRKKFMEKVKGDTGEKILDKCRRVFFYVTVTANRPEVGVVLQPRAFDEEEFTGTAKSLRAALMLALKKWAK